MRDETARNAENQNVVKIEIPHIICYNENNKYLQGKKQQRRQEQWNVYS